MQRFGSVVDAVGALKAEGYTIWAVKMTDNAVPCNEPAVPDKLAVVVGSKDVRVSPNVNDTADVIVYIPSVGLPDETVNISDAAFFVVFSVLCRASWCTWNDMKMRSRRMEFLEKELVAHPDDDSAWKRLGDIGGGTLDGKNYSRKDCLRKALALNPKNIVAWSDYGKVGGGLVHGRMYSKVECFLKAIASDYPDAWNSVGVLWAPLEVDGKRYFQQDCYEKALALNPKFSMAWHNLGGKGGGTVHGK